MIWHKPSKSTISHRLPKNQKRISCWAWIAKNINVKEWITKLYYSGSTVFRLGLPRATEFDETKFTQGNNTKSCQENWAKDSSKSLPCFSVSFKNWRSGGSLSTHFTWQRPPRVPHAIHTHRRHTHSHTYSQPHTHTYTHTHSHTHRLTHSHSHTIQQGDAIRSPFKSDTNVHARN